VRLRHSATESTLRTTGPLPANSRLRHANGLAVLVPQVLDGALGPVGSLVRYTSTSLAGTAGALAGTVTKRTGRALGGVVSVAGALSKRTATVLAGTVGVVGTLAPFRALQTFVPAHAMYHRADVDAQEVAWFDDDLLPLEFWYEEPPPSGARHLGVNLRAVLRLLDAAPDQTLYLPPPLEAPTLSYADVRDKTRVDPFAVDRVVELL